MINKLKVQNEKFKFLTETFHFTFFTLHSERQRGFTLIELLVVFSLVAIVSGVGFASLVTYSRTIALSQSALDVKLAIEKAKFNAISKVKPQACEDVNPALSYTLSSYKTSFCANCADYSYKVLAVCQRGAATKEVSLLQNKLPLNISFASIGCTSLEFNTLSSAVTCLGNSFSTVDITIQGYGQTRRVSVDSGGNVTVQ